MELHPARLVLGLKLCSSAILIFLLTFGLAIVGASGLFEVGMLLTALCLFSGSAVCASSVSGGPRAWALGIVLFLLGGMAGAYLPAFRSGLGPLVCALGVLVCGAGLVMGLGRTLGDRTTVGLAHRAVSTSLAAPFLCAVGGGLLEGVGFSGAFQGFFAVAFVLGPTLFMLYLAYLTFRLIPLIQSLKDGDKVGTDIEAPAPQF